MFLVVLMYIIFASTFTIGKFTLLYAQPIFLISIRMLLAGFFLLGYIFLFKMQNFRIKRKHIPWFLLIACFHIYIPYISEFWSLQYLSAGKTCLLYNLSPFISAIFSYVAFSETLTLKKILGLCLGFCGFIPVLMSPSPIEQHHLAFGFLSWPEIVMLISVISSVLGWVIFRKLTKEFCYSALLINGFGMALGGLFALITTVFTECQNSLPLVTNWFEFSKWLIILIIVANIISYNLYGYLLKKYTATFLAFAGFMCPIAASIIGRIFLAEPITKEFFFTLIIVSVGLYIFYQEDLRQGYTVRSSRTNN